MVKFRWIILGVALLAACGKSAEPVKTEPGKTGSTKSEASKTETPKNEKQPSAKAATPAQSEPEQTASAPPKNRFANTMMKALDNVKSDKGAAPAGPSLMDKIGGLLPMGKKPTITEDDFPTPDDDKSF
jgi:hypothetical protein